MRVLTAIAGHLLSLCVLTGCEQEQRDTPAATNSAGEVPSMTGQSELIRVDGGGPQLADIIRRALEAVLAVENDSERATLLSEIAVVQAKAGDRAASTESIRAAVALMESCDDASHKGFAMGVMALRQAEVGDIQGALDTNGLLRTGNFRGWSPAHTDLLHAYIAIGQAKQGRFDDAHRTMESICAAHQKSFALVQIGNEQWKRGDRERASATFQQAIQTAGQITNSYLKAKTLADLVDAYLAIGDRDSARELVDEVLRIASNEQQRGLRLGVLREAARAQAACGDVDGVLQTHDELLQDRLGRSLRAVVSEFKRGDLKSAFDSLSSIRLSRQNSPIVDDIVMAYANSGDFETAVEMAAAMSDSDWRRMTLSRVVQRQISVGRLTDAADTCATIDEGSYRARLFSEVAAAQMEAGNVELASTLFEQSHTICSDGLAKGESYASVRREIAANEAEAGRVKTSLAWAGRQQSARALAYALLGVAEGLQRSLLESALPTDVR